MTFATVLKSKMLEAWAKGPSICSGGTFSTSPDFLHPLPQFLAPFWRNSLFLRMLGQPLFDALFLGFRGKVWVETPNPSPDDAISLEHLGAKIAGHISSLSPDFPLILYPIELLELPCFADWFIRKPLPVFHVFI